VQLNPLEPIRLEPTAQRPHHKLQGRIFSQEWYPRIMMFFGFSVSPELLGFGLSLALSLLVGFEREERKPESQTIFGGIRTFPLIGLSGFLLASAFSSTPIPFSAGLVILGLLLLASYHSTSATAPGITSEVAAIITYIMGGVIANGLYWLATATAIIAVTLLQEKRRLERLAIGMPREELRSLLRFLLLTAVILPVVPNRSFTPFELNPFTIWLVVVAVSAVSYASYLLQRVLGRKHALLLTGILGGAYSSTVTTVALARQSRDAEECLTRQYAGAVLAATGAMYIRLWILILIFSPAMAARLTVLFLALGFLAIITGVVMNRKKHDEDCTEDAPEDGKSGNPLDIRSALSFAFIFTTVLVVTRLVSAHFGSRGIAAMAVIMGASDVDPFIMGLTQNAGESMSVSIAALAVVIAAASNNVMKGIYALSFGRRRAGRLSLALLGTWALVSLLGYYFLQHS